MEHAKHIMRAVLLLVLITLVFICVRHFAIPKSFGQYGHYRANSVAEFAEQTPVHGGPASCSECHDEQAETLAGGKHHTVSCETCHAPLRTHVTEDGEKIADMVTQRSFTLCAGCHERLVARPKEFPQVVLPGHVIENGGEMSAEVCLECHDDPHNPGG